jgi:hypothetical protein
MKTVQLDSSLWMRWILRRVSASNNNADTYPQLLHPGSPEELVSVGIISCRTHASLFTAHPNQGRIMVGIPAVITLKLMDGANEE